MNRIWYFSTQKRLPQSAAERDSRVVEFKAHHVIATLREVLDDLGYRDQSNRYELVYPRTERLRLSFLQRIIQKVSGGKISEGVNADKATSEGTSDDIMPVAQHPEFPMKWSVKCRPTASDLPIAEIRMRAFAHDFSVQVVARNDDEGTGNAIVEKLTTILGLEPKPSLVLLLSGGGFRAALFHLGVLKFLSAAGLLGSVRRIYGVSGGAVAAAHFVLHWQSAVRSSGDFDAIAARLISLTMKNVRGRVFALTLLTLPWWLAVYLFRLTRRMIRALTNKPITQPLRVLNPTKRLEGQYDAFLGGAMLSRLDEIENSSFSHETPRLRLLATDLGTGRPAVFSSSGVHLPIQGKADSEPQSPENFSKIAFRKTLPPGTIKLAKAVAASSAFPPAFKPVVLGPNHFHQKEDFMPYCLTDGGVFDNQGWLVFRSEFNEPGLFCEENSREPEIAQEPLHVFVSDASSPFRLQSGVNYMGMVERNSRASEILMRGATPDVAREIISRDEKGEVSSEARMADRLILCHCNLKSDRSESEQALDPQLQSWVSEIRTDLDRFTHHEVRCLVHHGYTSARMNFLKHQASAKFGDDEYWKDIRSRTANPWQGFNKSIKITKEDGDQILVSKIARTLRNGESTRLFRWTSFWSWMQVALLFVWIGTIAFGLAETKDRLDKAYLKASAGTTVIHEVLSASVGSLHLIDLPWYAAILLMVFLIIKL